MLPYSLNSYSQSLKIPTNKVQLLLPSTEASVERFISGMSDLEKKVFVAKTKLYFKKAVSHRVEPDHKVNFQEIRVKIVHKDHVDIFSNTNNRPFFDADILVFRSNLQRKEIVCSSFTMDCEESDLKFNYYQLSDAEIMKRAVGLFVRLKIVGLIQKSAMRNNLNDTYGI